MSYDAPELGTGAMLITPGRTLIHFGGISAPPEPYKSPLIIDIKGEKK